MREMFRVNLLELPAEVVLYWFTLCFYGYRQQAGRVALRTLLTYEQAEEKPERKPVQDRKWRKDAGGPTLFDTSVSDASTPGPSETIKQHAKKRTKLTK